MIYKISEVDGDRNFSENISVVYDDESGEISVEINHSDPMMKKQRISTVNSKTLLRILGIIRQHMK